MNVGSYSLKLLELYREEKNLTISIRLKGDYNPNVKEPKLAVIFDNGREKRRIPLLIQSYFPEKDLNGFVLYAKYAYRMDYLFFQQPVNERIDFWFEVTYGNTVIEKMPYQVSGDIRTELDPDYTIDLRDESGICTYRLLNKEEPPVAPAKSKGKARICVEALWTAILFVIVIPLLPVFGLEALLAWAGLVGKIAKNNKTGILFPINHVRLRVSGFIRKGFGVTDSKNTMMNLAYWYGSHRKVNPNQIVFLSNRRTDLTGNFEFVYNVLKQDPKLEMHFVLDVRDMKEISYKNAMKYGYYCATSKVILVDDYVAQLYKLPRREGTVMIQLWHACGAFKTFGYSRLGKPGGQKQTSASHRNYDYCIVSSREIAKFYAEGFGISLDKPVATGIPRTDIFFDQAYKEKVTSDFYAKYPKLKDKKIILFAPTFRGNGKLSGYYPVEKFDVAKLYEELGGEYAIIVKHHPFVQDRNVIPEKYQDAIIDLSMDSELNDLLFVTDLLITDYSSAIFEAALLDIPMLFFAFDLQRYIATRGFYYEFEEFVPGKIVASFGQAVTAIRKQDFETEKIESFKTRFFDDLDGKSTQRTVDLIYRALQE